MTSTEWNPVTDKYGAFIPIVGTLVTSGIALLIAIPVSFGIALFLTELSPTWLRRPLGIAVELLAGIPASFTACGACSSSLPIFADQSNPGSTTISVTMPFIGTFFSGPPMGIGILTAGLILADHDHPLHRLGDARRVRGRAGLLKESAYGLGATTWEVVWNVVLPYTKIGVVGGIMLGLGRALGETMAVTFVIGNSHLLEHFAAPAGQQHLFGTGQRIRRGRRRSTPLR